MTSRLEYGESVVQVFDFVDDGLLPENPSPNAMMELIHTITSVGCLVMAQNVGFFWLL
jgi:hypothetical protein